MPIHQEQGTKSGWGLHKVLNHFGAEKPVNYITADFYDKLETIYAGFNASEPMGKDMIATLKEMDEMRTLESIPYCQANHERSINLTSSIITLLSGGFLFLLCLTWKACIFPF